MKSSNQISKPIRMALVVAGLGIGILVSYQNCGVGFAPMDSQSAGGEQNSAASDLSVGGEKHVMLDDMILTETQHRELTTPNRIGAAGAYIGSIVKWPNGVIPIQFSNAVLSKYGATFESDQFERAATDTEIATLKATLTEVCNRLAAVTNVRCEFVNGNRDRMAGETPNPAVLTVNIGPMWRGQTDNTLVCGSSPACANIGGPGTVAHNSTKSYRPFIIIKQDLLNELPLVFHEFGHVLGLDHEHMRPDRDNFLVFQPGTDPGATLARTVMHTRFDFGSIMSYKYGSTRWDQYSNYANWTGLGGYVRAIRPEFDADSIREILVGGHHGHIPNAFSNYVPVALPTVLDVRTIVALYGAPSAPRASCALGGETIPHGSYIPVYLNDVDPQIGFCPGGSSTLHKRNFRRNRHQTSL